MTFAKIFMFINCEKNLFNRKARKYVSFFKQY